MKYLVKELNLRHTWNCFPQSIWSGLIHGAKSLIYVENSLHVFLFAYLSNPNMFFRRGEKIFYVVSLTNSLVATVCLDNACKGRKVMGFALLLLPSVKDLSQKVSWGSIYQRPSSLGHWVSRRILIIKGTGPASSLEMKPWAIFKSGALNFWWTVTQTGITTIQKITSTSRQRPASVGDFFYPSPLKFPPCPPNKNTPCCLMLPI